MSEESLFHEALAKPPAERADFLDAACARQPELRAAVEALLAAHEASDALLDCPPAHLAQTVDPEPGPAHPDRKGELTPQPMDSSAPVPTTASLPQLTPGPVIAGRYTLAQKIGEGGMGEVWVAKQTEPVKRRVAFKLIKPGMDSRAVLARFEHERQALAMMDHPNIARVFDGGLTPDGRPFFVMELVNGLPLTRFCDKARLTPRERLELLVPICQAVQHAHQKGIVHRDLKPSNILVTLIDGRPLPKVIDFGVAKAVSGKLTDEMVSTQFGAVVGTFEYMAPEQAGYSGKDVDTRADIYSLGVIIYELLTGLKPHDGKRLRQAALSEMVRIIREEEPSKPSTRLSTDESLPSLAAMRKTEPKRLMAMLRGELDWVVMKCLEKQRDRRYETANGLARDIQRYLADEPVEARPPSASYRLRKFAQRHKGAVLAVSVFAVLLLSGIIGTATGLVRALEAERQAVTERDQKEEARKKAVAAATAEAEARRQTRQALNAMTDEVVQDLLARQVQLTDQHRKFLRNVLAHHAAFAASKADDPESRESRAEGLSRVGRLRHFLGEFTEAEAAYREALALFGKLADDMPNRPEFRHNAATSCCNIATLLRDTGQAKEAERAYRDALAIQKQLVADQPDRPESRFDLATSHTEFGILLEDAGRVKEAEAEHKSALTIKRQLAEDFPKRSDFRKALAASYNELGGVFRISGRPGEAETALRASLAIKKQLVMESPRQPELRKTLALGHSNLATFLVATGRPQEALAEHRAALALRKVLAEEFPSRPDLRFDLAQSHMSLANLFFTVGRPKNAEPEYSAAYALLKQLSADAPNRPQFRIYLAQARGFWGMAQQAMGRLNEAEAALRESVDLHRSLVAEFPKIPDYRNSLAGALGNFAALHNQRKEFAKALALLEHARPHHQAVIEANPKHPVYRRLFRVFLERIAQSQRGLGNHGQVTAAAEELAQVGFDPPNDTFLASCFLSSSVGLVEKDAELPVARRDELRQRYANRAMALLEQAKARGFRDVARIKNVPDLEPLRKRDDYSKLVRELEAAKAPSPNAEDKKR
jgi:serine/threonine protein kinase/tetratricopeptide (TPR) repeat protein